MWEQNKFTHLLLNCEIIARRNLYLLLHDDCLGEVKFSENFYVTEDCSCIAATIGEKLC